MWPFSNLKYNLSHLRLSLIIAQERGIEPDKSETFFLHMVFKEVPKIIFRKRLSDKN